MEPFIAQASLLHLLYPHIELLLLMSAGDENR